MTATTQPDAVVTAAGVVEMAAVVRALQSDVRLRQDARGWYALSGGNTYRLTLEPNPACSCQAGTHGAFCKHLALLRVIVAVLYTETAEERIGIADTLERLELLEARVERVLGGAG